MPGCQKRPAGEGDEGIVEPDICPEGKADKGIVEPDEGIADPYIDETIALWRNPGGPWLNSAGAEATGSAFVFMCDGVRPEGTSMNVFLTGSGTPLFVAPSP